MSWRRLVPAFVGLLTLITLTTAPARAAVDIAGGERIGPLPGWPRILAQSTQVQSLRPGVTLSSVQLLTPAGMLRAYQLDTDLTAPGVSLGTVVASNSVVSVGETVSSMATRTNAVGGVNGDYFAIHESGVPLNWTIQNGNLIRSGNHWAVFGWTDQHQVNIGKYTWTGALTVKKTGAWFPVEAVNLPLMDHKIIAVNQSMGSPMAAKNATLVYLQPAGDDYKVTSVQQGQNYVPPVNGDTVLLAGEGVAATWLALNVPQGSQLHLDYSSKPDWHDLQSAIGGGPILVQNGYPYQDPEAPAAFETNRPYPVSGVGINQDGTKLSMVVVDGHEGKPYLGLTRPQFAWYFQTIGAWNAMAFDSGGSAQMAVRQPGMSYATVVNHPSDGRERQVADGLFVYA